MYTTKSPTFFLLMAFALLAFSILFVSPVGVTVTNEKRATSSSNSIYETPSSSSNYGNDSGINTNTDTSEIAKRFL
jgi:hypothetical protein